MNANISFSLKTVKQFFIKLLRRFHVVIFVIVVIGGTAVVVFMLNGIIIRSAQSDGYTSSYNSTSFDQSTIKKIEELKTRDQSGPITLPGGRINPFVE